MRHRLVIYLTEFVKFNLRLTLSDITVSIEQVFLYNMRNFMVIILSLIFSFQFADQEDIHFNILHSSSILSTYLQIRGKYGVGRMITFIKKFKKEQPNTLYFDTGAYFTGSVWYEVHKWRIAADFMKLLNPDAMALGKREFVDRISGLTNFLRASNVKMLCTNCDFTQEYELQGLIQKSLILKVGTTKVGVISYLTQEAAIKINPVSFGKVKLEDEVSAIRHEVEKLTAANITIIILLGHGEEELDKQIIEKTQDIDVLLAGLSRLFLYKGKVPKEFKQLTKDGEYPRIHNNLKGVAVPVIHAYQQTILIGQFSMTFTETGELYKWSGNPMGLVRNIPQDPEALKLIEKYRPEVEKFQRRVLGQNRVLLNASCKYSECNLGNLAADAMVEYVVAHYRGKYWTDTAIALINAGSFKNHIKVERIDYKITAADFLTAVPYDNQLFVVTVNGTVLHEILEFSNNEKLFKHRGRFLQYSGIQVVFDQARDKMDKVETIKIRCAECHIPKYEELDPEKHYNIIVIEFIEKGGDGFIMFETKTIKKEALPVTLVGAIEQYIHTYKMISPKCDRRIVIKNAHLLQTTSGICRYYISIFIFFCNILYLTI